jgi:hypothetical protein
MVDVQVLEKQYSAAELVEIRNLLMQVEKNNPSGLTPTSNPPYGPYQDGSGRFGTFSYPGIRTEMFSAFQRPRSLASILGVRPSRIANEKIGIMTGVTAGAGTNPADFCGTAPTAGQLKRCVQNYIWGKMYWKTNVNNIAEAGEYIDTADVEKRILNLQQNPNPFIPDIMGRLDIARRDGALLASELFTLGAEIERNLELVLVRGNETLAPAATTRGFIKEFRGLERQITTGRVDLDTGQPCPAADSQVISWGTGIDSTVGGRTFPQVIVDTMFGLKDIARQAGLDGTRWVLSMPMRMFRALTYVYACEYWTSRCQGSAGNPSYTDAMEVRRLQLDMMQGRYLLIDGEPVEVIFTDGILETRASGNTYTASEMFFLPVEWNGMRLLNLQFKPMDNADAMEFATFGNMPAPKSLNGGQYLVTTNFQNFCYEHLFASKFRLIQDAPFLAAAINTIQYTYSAPYRSAYPSDTISYVDGGATVWDGNYTVS